MDLIVGALHKTLSETAGEEWNPAGFCFTYGPPSDLSAHQRVFGESCSFNQSFNGVIVYSKDLDAPNVLADPLLRPVTRRYLDSISSPLQTSNTAREVREVVVALLPTGRCSLQQVARTLGMDRKTVHRHLARCGESFSSVLSAARMDLAPQYLIDHGRSVTETAELLGFSSVSTFSRWFLQTFGKSPTAWRATRIGG